MSVASAWSASVTADDGKVAATEAQRPPDWRGAPSTLVATVTRAGGAQLNKEATLTPDEALSLGNWLVATFG